MVPAVVAVSVSVVSVGSMSEFDRCLVSYLVGVVIVVWRLFSIKNMKKGDVGSSVSRFMFMSPCIVIDVLGYRVYISSIASCMCRAKFVIESELGLLYIFMIVWIGSVFVLVLCICSMIVCTFGIVISSMYEMFMSLFVYTVTSPLCLCVYSGMGKLFWFDSFCR